MRHFWILSAPLLLISPVLAAPQSPMRVKAPTDAQIVAIVRAVNEAEINAATVAKSKSTNPAIKNFAEQMLKNHTQAHQDSKTLESKTKVKPEKNAQSALIARSARDTLAHLKKLKGLEFDQAYIAQEVAMHEQVLSDIDSMLLPNVKDEEAKALLQRVRPVVDQHLQHAKHLQATLEDKS